MGQNILVRIAGVEIPEVQSVNGKTGIVVLRISDLQNDREYTVKTYVDDLVRAEATARANADTQLANGIASLLAQIQSVASGLQTEVNARQSADAELGQAISAEQTARNNADNTLQGNINAEALARQQADNLLQPKEQGKGLSANDYSDTEKQNVSDNTLARHSHSNKALLDTYTQTEIDLADAVSKKHSHDNKGVLDAITSQTVEKANNSVQAETGKGLSTNDYTNAEKQKVASALQPSDAETISQTEIDNLWR